MLPKPLQHREYPITWPYDWREESNYNYIKSNFTRHQWAWEFLKRNIEYQNDWLRLAAEYRDSMNRRGKKHIKMPDNLLAADSVQKWGIVTYVNPVHGDLGFKALKDNIAFFPIHGTLLFSNERIEPVSPVRGINVDIEHFNIQNHALGVFDIKLPIRPQIQKIEALLRAKQKRVLGLTSNQGLRDTSGFKNYVRHLDALADSSSTEKEIIDRIYKHYPTAQKAYRRSERVAKELSDGGYRAMI